MSVSAVASLRPLRGQCFRTASSGLLSVHIKSRCASIHLRAVIPLHPPPLVAPQRRFQSTDARRRSSRGNDRPNAPRQDQLVSGQQKPKERIVTIGRPSIAQLTRNLRIIGFFLSPTGIRAGFREKPLWTILFVAIVAAILYTLATSMYKAYRIDMQCMTFPEPAGTTLRWALFYSDHWPDPERALRYYKLAVEQCREVGLDDFSDEVLGLRIRISQWLLRIRNYPGTTQVLESVLGDVKTWLDAMEQSVRDGKIDSAGQPVTPSSQKKPAVAAAPEAQKESQPAPAATPDDESIPENLWHKRRRLLKLAVSTSLRLGQLYAEQDAPDLEKSHRRLAWAVETGLAEFRRRKAEGVKEGEGDWLSPEETGGMFEALAHDYESRSQFAVAIPLFFQALRLCDSPCHRPVIMNNLAASFAQLPFVSSPADSSSSPSSPSSSLALQGLNNPTLPTTAKDSHDFALNWARNSYQHAAEVRGEARTPECDEACAVALCTWGDVAAMMGNADLAREKYNQCVRMSNRVQFRQGVEQARAGLERIGPKTA